MRLLLAILLFISLQSQGQIVRTHPYYKPFVSSTVCSDADAQKFIDSAGITDQTQKDAICTLVRELKDSSLWSSMNAIYPFVGGTASAHKWNLKNPQNTDAAFRITFTGSWTHSSSGADPDASTAYGNTYVNGSSTLSEYDRHWSLYYTQSTANQGWDGFFDGTRVFGLQVYNGSKLVHGLNTLTVSTYETATNSGYFIGSVNSSSANDATVYRNGVSVVTTTALSLAPNINFFIGATNSNCCGSPILHTDRNFAFVTLGSKLTSDQARALNTIVEKFNDTLGRGVQ